VTGLFSFYLVLLTIGDQNIDSAPVKDTAVSMTFEGQACSNFAQTETQIIYNLSVFTE